VARDGPEDDLRLDGGYLHASRFGGRVERRNAALAEALERVEKGAILTRAAVAREREAKATALEALEASIRAEVAAELEEARDLIARSKSLGSKSVGFDEKVWSTAPFAREVMRKFRVTLAIKRAFESLCDDVATEIAAEAIPEARRETRREIREAFKDMPSFSESDGEESDGMSESAASESSVTSGFSGRSRSSFDDDDDGGGGRPNVFKDKDVGVGVGVVASDAFGARSSVADGVTAIGARRRSSKRGVRLLLEADSEKRFSGTANETETSAEVSDGPSDDSERDESDVGSPRRDAAADDSDADASTDTYSVSDVSDVSTPSVTDSDVDEDEAGRA